MYSRCVYIEILSIGDELVTGGLVDTNSAYIANACEIEGFEVTKHTTVGDHLPILVHSLLEISDRADIAIVSGGLGPTLDDLTRQAAAEAANVELVLDQDALSQMKAFFEKMGLDMPETNKRQAFFPKGARILSNPIGTAPGFSMQIGKAQMFFCPGVPREMKKMLQEQVFPQISKTFHLALRKMEVKTLFTFGFTEAVLGEYLEELNMQFPQVKFGTRAHFPGIEIKLSIRGEASRLQEVYNKILHDLGNEFFVSENQTMASVVGDLLKKEGASLSILEIDEGGIFADWMRDAPPVAKFMGVMNLEMIESLFQVKSDFSDKELAKKVMKLTGSSYGLVMHYDNEIAQISIASKDNIVCYSYEFKLGNKEHKLQFFTMLALDLLRRKILNLPVTPILGRSCYVLYNTSYF